MNRPRRVLARKSRRRAPIHPHAVQSKLWAFVRLLADHSTSIPRETWRAMLTAHEERDPYLFQVLCKCNHFDSTFPLKVEYSPETSDVDPSDADPNDADFSDADPSPSGLGDADRQCSDFIAESEND